MAKHSTQKSLDSWTKEEWGTKSGKTLLKVLKLQVSAIYLRKLVLL